MSRQSTVPARSPSTPLATCGKCGKRSATRTTTAATTAVRSHRARSGRNSGRSPLRRSAAHRNTGKRSPRRGTPRRSWRMSAGRSSRGPPTPPAVCDDVLPMSRIVCPEPETGGRLLIGWRVTVPDAPLDRPASMHWPTPVIMLDPSMAEGPVLVTVEYHVPPDRVGAFFEAMRAVRRSRLRAGAAALGPFPGRAAPRDILGDVPHSFLGGTPATARGFGSPATTGSPNSRHDPCWSLGILTRFPTISRRGVSAHGRARQAFSRRSGQLPALALSGRRPAS